MTDTTNDPTDPLEIARRIVAREEQHRQSVYEADLAMADLSEVVSEEEYEQAYDAYRRRLDQAERRLQEQAQKDLATSVTPDQPAPAADRGNRDQSGYRLATDAEAMAGILAAVEAGEMSVYVSEKETRAELAAALADVHEAMARAAAVEKAGRVGAGYEAVTSPFEWRLWRTMTHAIAAVDRMIELDPALDHPILANVKVGDDRTAEVAELDDTERDALLVPAHVAAGKAAERAQVLLDRLTADYGHTEQEEAVWAEVDERLDRIAGTLRVNSGELAWPAFRAMVRTDWEHEAAERAELAATYDQLSAAGRAEALSLGIAGHDAAANAERRDLAQRLQVEHSQRNKAYFTGQTAERPISPPFGLRLIVKHEGDLAAVIADDAINGDLITALTLASPGEERDRGWSPRPDDLDRLAEERGRLADQLGLESQDTAEAGEEYSAADRLEAHALEPVSQEGRDRLVATPYGPGRIEEAFYGYGLDADASTPVEGYRVVVAASGAEKLIKAEHVSTDPAEIAKSGLQARYSDGSPVRVTADGLILAEDEVCNDDWDRDYWYRIPQRNTDARQTLAASLFEADTALGRAEEIEDQLREAAGYDEVNSEFALDIDFARGDVQRAIAEQRLIEGTPGATAQASAEADAAGDQRPAIDTAAAAERAVTAPAVDSELGEGGHSLGAHRDADTALSRARSAFDLLRGTDDAYAEWDRTDATPTNVDLLGELIGSAQAMTRSNLDDLQTPGIDDRIRADWKDQDEATLGLAPEYADDARFDDDSWWSEPDAEAAAEIDRLLAVVSRGEGAQHRREAMPPDAPNHDPWRDLRTAPAANAGDSTATPTAEHHDGGQDVDDDAVDTGAVDAVHVPATISDQAQVILSSDEIRLVRGLLSGYRARELAQVENDEDGEFDYYDREVFYENAHRAELIENRLAAADLELREARAEAIAESHKSGPSKDLIRRLEQIAAAARSEGDVVRAEGTEAVLSDLHAGYPSEVAYERSRERDLAAPGGDRDPRPAGNSADHPAQDVAPDFERQPLDEPPDETAVAVHRAGQAVHDLQQRQTEDHRRTAAERARHDEDLVRWHQQDQQQHAAIERTDSQPVLDRADYDDR
ncbi:coiled-coil domain-containing protein [Microlunatus parietis]|uniref:Uncharacterized protein n=1 Tax=Microlunatus parietis TaxID=682979 RepID=A0A7Y9LEW5_9ACTN|nr:hypothetical protein [Microlunatus parietis]NYE74248.1 hypothetical protein [Microlunatus parietis]